MYCKTIWVDIHKNNATFSSISIVIDLFQLLKFSLKVKSIHFKEIME